MNLRLFGFNDNTKCILCGSETGSITIHLIMCCQDNFSIQLKIFNIGQDNNVAFIFIHSSKLVSMIRKYHNHKLQTSPWHREEEPLNHQETPGRQTKQSNQLSLPHQDDCNARMDIK